MTIRPLFILSLPRSGSTLVQRVISSDPAVSTAAEPWLLLPQLYALRDRGAVAEYGHGPAARAIGDFARTLPGGERDYLAELRRFTLGLYERAARPGSTYFLDKTPRYHLVAEDLFRVFPDGKFVFLWRNPLAVAASIIQTWASDKWTFGRWRVDLYKGVAGLVAAYRDHAPVACAVTYEELVMQPAPSWGRVFDYLRLTFDPHLLHNLAPAPGGGRMGDRMGSGAYPKLDSAPVGKWVQTFGNAYRKRWARGYLEWIGEERLGVMGYDLGTLLKELEAVPTSRRLLPSDVARSAYAWVEGSRRRSVFRKLS